MCVSGWRSWMARQGQADGRSRGCGGGLLACGPGCEGVGSGYEFDVFLSYRRSGQGNAGAWVRHHFHPLLVGCLADELDHEPTVFIDVGAETGAYWPGLLERRLQRSRVVVAVLSPRYFESAWCLAEWQTARAREEALGMATALNPGTSVLYPVVFSDSDSFPEDARSRQARELKRWR